MQIVTLVAISATVDALRQRSENRRLRRRLNESVKIITAQSKMLIYAMDIMDRHEIPFEEFDAIVFEQIAREREEGA